MSQRRTVFVAGSVIGFTVKDGLNCRDAGIDPSLSQDAIGVTWDVLDECVAYGLSANAAQKLFGVRPLSRGDAIRAGEGAQASNHGGGEQRVRGAASRDGGHLAEVGDGFIYEYDVEDVMDRRPGPIWSRLRAALAYLVHGDIAVQSGHQRREPRAFSALLGEFEQNGGGRVLKRLDNVCGYSVIPLRFNGHCHSLRLVVAESEAQLDAMCESAIREAA